jgi:FlaA1/EpsC-like NDP-sugar epimerase
VLIFGAGRAGQMIVHEMRHGNHPGYEPVGFVDDDPDKVGRFIHEVQVLGNRAALEEIITTGRPHEVLIAIPRADAHTLNDILHALHRFKVPITSLPSIRDLTDGVVRVAQIRELAVEDLLPRAPIHLDDAAIRRLITGARVMVTGAGGSIGSGLCRQIMAFSPERLVLYERDQNNLFDVHNALAAYGDAVRPVVGDITDARRVGSVLAAHRPQLLFHAAAHKHVPLTELNPCEAVKNNVLGTRTVATLAMRYGVERFILISTDKAANPASIMGATKRVDEMMMQAFSSRRRTRFVAVRFGNVLGSSGSVVGRILEQVSAGEPVTITHPEMRRFFLLIPEAVALVLQSATIAADGGIFVLDMGEPVRILDLARNLIRIAGHIPDQELQIVFTGPRPGEKLREELVAADETVAPSGRPGVLRVTPRAPLEPAKVSRQVAELIRRASREDARGVLRQLQRMIASFTPDPTQWPHDWIVNAPRRRIDAPRTAPARRSA